MKLRFRGLDNPAIKGFQRRLFCNENYTVGKVYDVIDGSIDISGISQGYVEDIILVDTIPDIHEEYNGTSADAQMIGDDGLCRYIELAYFDLVED